MGTAKRYWMAWLLRSSALVLRHSCLAGSLLAGARCAVGQC